MEEQRAETTTLIETSEEKRSRERQNPPLPKAARVPHDILSRAPTETILDCKLVCKRWENLLQYGGSITSMICTLNASFNIYMLVIVYLMIGLRWT
ncbi:hypothetical protein C5167_021206 [Papaver somniferum]|uniref:F-box domain-containing protein n=1 Tax=Papaver somniferum TaxID=3469 RepID=A0A4Y7IV75_PAPSO|nr:hypothetical protein C5167_021206 [Papaver somniferum]